MLFIFMTNLNTQSPSSLELRELRAKLRAGYMNKERAVQLAEKQAANIYQKVLET